jgi:hypothetical protein
VQPSKATFAAYSVSTAFFLASNTRTGFVLKRSKEPHPRERGAFHPGNLMDIAAESNKKLQMVFSQNKVSE